MRLNCRIIGKRGGAKILAKGSIGRRTPMGSHGCCRQIQKIANKQLALFRWNSEDRTRFFFSSLPTFPVRLGCAVTVQACWCFSEQVDAHPGRSNPDLLCLRAEEARLAVAEHVAGLGGNDTNESRFRLNIFHQKKADGGQERGGGCLDDFADGCRLSLGKGEQTCQEKGSGLTIRQKQLISHLQIPTKAFPFRFLRTGLDNRGCGWDVSQKVWTAQDFGAVGRIMEAVVFRSAQKDGCTSKQNKLASVCGGKKQSVGVRIWKSRPCPEPRRRQFSNMVSWAHFIP